MNQKNLTRISKFLSYVLRHNPGAIGIVLDESGWTNIDQLIERMQGRFPEFSETLLYEIVRTDEKKRYAVSSCKIRAQQGHSININEVGQIQPPPEFLYHGTSDKNWDAIQADGSILPMGRQHVHLSTDIQTATQVASRRRNRQHIILLIRAAEMHEHGHAFLLSGNDVWLTDKVPIEFVKIVNKSDAG